MRNSAGRPAALCTPSTFKQLPAAGPLSEFNRTQASLTGAADPVRAVETNEGLLVTYAIDFQERQVKLAESGGRSEYYAPAANGIQWTNEQRAWPRIRGEFPVALRNGLGQHCAATLQNISPDGLQVRCTVQTARIIHPQFGPLMPGDQPLLQATVVLPLEEGPQTLSAGVRLLHLAAVESPFCILGFRFLELRPRARRIIDAFYAEQLRQGDL